MLQFDANAHADANVDGRVNGPLVIASVLADMAKIEYSTNCFASLLYELPFTVF